MLAIVEHPAEILRKPAQEIAPAHPAIHALAARLLETQARTGALGVAAPQIGYAARVFVAKMPWGIETLCNPRILDQQGDHRDWEGCLSIPGRVYLVRRPVDVIVEATKLDGATLRLEASGWCARLLCHELDHLDGVLVVDHQLGRKS